MRYNDLSFESKEFISHLQMYGRGVTPIVSFSIATAIAYDIPLPSICNDDTAAQILRCERSNIVQVVDHVLQHVVIDYKAIVELVDGIYRTRVAIAGNPRSFKKAILDNNCEYIPSAYLKLAAADSVSYDLVLAGFKSFITDLRELSQAINVGAA